MLKWFKKLVNNEEELKDQQANHKQQEEEPISLLKQQSYPKGQFRFPLDVDGEKRKPGKVKTEELQPVVRESRVWDTEEIPSLDYDKQHVERFSRSTSRLMREPLLNPRTSRERVIEREVEEKREMSTTVTKEVSEEKKKPFAPTPFYSPVHGIVTPKNLSKKEEQEEDGRTLIQKSIGLHDKVHTKIIVNDDHKRNVHEHAAIVRSPLQSYAVKEPVATEKKPTVVVTESHLEAGTTNMSSVFVNRPSGIKVSTPSTVKEDTNTDGENPEAIVKEWIYRKVYSSEENQSTYDEVTLNEYNETKLDSSIQERDVTFEMDVVEEAAIENEVVLAEELTEEVIEEVVEEVLQAENEVVLAEELTEEVVEEVVEEVLQAESEVVLAPELIEEVTEGVVEEVLQAENEVVLAPELTEEVIEVVEEILQAESEVVLAPELTEEVVEEAEEVLQAESEVVLAPELTEEVVEEAEEVLQAESEVVLAPELTEEQIVVPPSIEDEVKMKEVEVNEYKETAPIQTVQPKPMTTVSQPRRSTVPFNVMMLQQDKLLYERKKTSDVLPPLSLLQKVESNDEHDLEWLEEQQDKLNKMFADFKVKAEVVRYTKGPSVTRYEVKPRRGVKVNKITALADDIKLTLAAEEIRIEAPIPGKDTVGIEVPNRKRRTVGLREILSSSAFLASKSPLTAVLGLEITGRPVLSDLSKMPHGLIAGATGSGKSVCVNSILVSLLFKATPEEVKLMLIDPKMVELAPYNDIPHLVCPVITDAKVATQALRWAVGEMERRYELFVESGVRDRNRYNELVQKGRIKNEKLPYLVIVIDELADLMAVASNEVEEHICRIAQKARACGIHLLIATQRPSVDVITGLIKANIPARIAFSVFSQIDSRTILDSVGAEKLLGKGDMLLLENGSNKPIRVQGTYVSDDEIEAVLQYVKSKGETNYLFLQSDLLVQDEELDGEDVLFQDVVQFIAEQKSVSASSIQRRFRVGFNRAARLVEELEARGFVSKPNGSKPREVFVDKIIQER